MKYCESLCTHYTAAEHGVHDKSINRAPLNEFGNAVIRPACNVFMGRCRLVDPGLRHATSGPGATKCLAMTPKNLSFRPRREICLCFYPTTSRFRSSFEMTVCCLSRITGNIQNLVISNPATPGEKSASPQWKKNKQPVGWVNGFIVCPTSIDKFTMSGCCATANRWH